MQIPGRQFSRFDFDRAHEQSNKAIKFIIKPMDFINHVNNELQRRWEIAELKIDKYLDQV